MDSLTASNGPRFYPIITIKRNTQANKFYAFPILGLLVKIIMLIPVSIGLFFVFLAVLVINFLINPLVVLFTGKYWSVAQQFSQAVLQYCIKTQLFFTGLTDTYPWFTADIKDDYTVTFPNQQTSNRLYAIPLIGLLIRFILLIPFFIWVSIIQYGAFFAMLGSFWNVLTKGVYPESTYEFIHDQLRLSFASTAYIFGLSDTYPSFWISMHHKNIKWLLIILGIIIFIFNQYRWQHTQQQYRYQNSGSYGNYQQFIPTTTQNYPK